jgi:hypothetical protein
MPLLRSFYFLFCNYLLYSCSGLLPSIIYKIRRTKVSFNVHHSSVLSASEDPLGDRNKIFQRKEKTPKNDDSKNFFLRIWKDKIDAILYTDKESNRKFRRTVFDKQNWRRHRSSNRYFQELRNMPKSVILRGLGVQTLVVTLFSLFIVSYNTLVELKKFPFPMPVLSFPALPFALTSSSLGMYTSIQRS